MTRKTIFAVVSVVVALAIATVLWFNRSTSVGQNQGSSPGAVVTVTPSLPPDPRETAIEEATALYQEYSDTSWAMVKAGAPNNLVEELRLYVTGAEWKTVKADAKFIREQKAQVNGDRKVHFLSAKDIDLSATDPTLTLNVCLDLSGVDVINPKGEKINGDWTQSQVYMIKDDKGWKIQDRDDEIRSDSCIG